MKTLLCFYFASAAFVACVHADISVRETFPYPLGMRLSTTTADADNGWSSGWMGDITLAIPLEDSVTVAEGLTSPAFDPAEMGRSGNGFRSLGNKPNDLADMYRRLNSPINWATPSVRYISAFLFWEANHHTAASRMVFRLNGNEATYFGLTGNGVDDNKMRLVIRNTYAETVFGEELFESGETYMLVAKIETVATGTDSVSLAVFRPEEGWPNAEPSWELVAAQARSDRSDVIGFDGQTYRSAMLGFDDFRMGSALAAVTADYHPRERFNYPSGTQLNTTRAEPSEGWSSGWKQSMDLAISLGDDVAVSEGSLSNDAHASRGLSPVGGKIQQSVSTEFRMSRGLSRPIDWAQDSVTYFSSLVLWRNSHPSVASRVYFELGDTGTRFGLRGNGTDTNKLRLSVDRSSSSRYHDGGPLFDHNQTYLFVAKIKTFASGSDRISLAMIGNSAALSSSEPIWQHEVTLDRSDLTQEFGFGSILYYFNSEISIDELRMGSSWGEVSANQDPVLALKPVGYWPMDEGSGRQILDLSGNGNHAEAFALPWRGGLASFEWDTYQWIQVPHRAAYASPSFSVGLWVYNGLHERQAQESDASADEKIVLFGHPLRMSGNAMVWENIADRLPEGFRLRMGFPVENGASLLKLSHAPEEDSLGLEENKVTLPTASWQHVCYTYDESGVGKLYINGQLAHQASGLSYRPSDMPLVLGGGQWGVNVSPTQSMQGSLRNAALYDRVLTGTEVADLCEGSQPDTSLVYQPAPAGTDIRPWPSMTVDELLAAVRDVARSDHDRAMATMELAKRGPDARIAVPELRDQLFQLGVANGDHIPRVEEIYRNALIHALLSIEPDRPDVAQVLDTAYAGPYVETLNWQDDLAGTLYATHRQNGNWHAALQVAREHMASLSQISAITGWGSTTLHTQLDGIQSRLPLDERYFNRFFNRQNPYYDAHYTAYNQVEVLPDGAAYAMVVDRISYEEAYAQWSANLKSYDSTVPDANGLWARVRVIRLHSDGSREEQRFVGDWFIFDVRDEKYYGWSIIRDKNGYLHIVGGMHNAPQRYRYLPGVWQRMGLEDATPYTMYWISAQPDSMVQFDFHGLGSDPRYLPKVRNYMKFTKSPDGEIFISGRGDNWTFGFARYEAESGVWKEITGSFADMMATAGTANAEWVENLGGNIQPYYFAGSAWMQSWQPGYYNFARAWRRSPMGGVTFDRSGRMYAQQFLYGVGEKGKMTDVSMIVYSDDLGKTFHDVTGELLILPITNNPIPGHNASIESGDSPDYLAVWQKMLNSYEVRPTRAFAHFHDPEAYPQPEVVISEAVDLAGVTWSMYGRAAMQYEEFVNADGNFDALQLSTLPGESVSFSTTLSGPGFIEFSYKTATEAGGDVFSFSVNGVEQVIASGNGNWQTFRQSIPLGTHTLEWKYQKDAASNDSRDAVFLDQFVWTEDSSAGDLDGDGTPDYLDLDLDGDGTSNLDESATGRNPRDAADLAFEFNKDGDFEGWDPRWYVTETAVGQGALVGRSTTSSAFIYKQDLHFDASSLPSLSLRLRADKNTTLAVYFDVEGTQTAGSSSYYSGGGEWQVITLSFAEISSYQGIITRLMLLVWEGDTSFEIDWIRASALAYPSISATSPSNGADLVALDADFVATFDEAIVLGSGEFELWETRAAAPLETFLVGSSDRLTISGQSLTVDPTGLLESGRSYYVRVASGSIVSAATGNAFAGIAEETTWKFTTDSTYAGWIAVHEPIEGSRGLDSDSDGDGIVNGIENYFGTDPTRASRGMKVAGADYEARTFRLIHPRNANPASDIVGHYRWSSDLVNWHPSGETLNGSTVTFEARTLEDGDVEVTAIGSGEPLQKLFVTLEVVNH